MNDLKEYGPDDGTGGADHRMLCEIGRSQAMYDLGDAVRRLEAASEAIGLTERDKMDLVKHLEVLARLAGEYSKGAA